MNLISRFLDRVSDRVELLVKFGQRGGLTMLAIAFAIGTTIWPLMNTDLLMPFWYNSINWEARKTAAILVGIGTIATLLVYLVLVLRARITSPKDSRPTVTEAVERINRWTLPLLGLPFLIYLMIKPIERVHPLLTVTFAAIVGGILGISVYRLVAPRDDPRPSARLIAPIVLTVLTILVGVTLCSLAVNNHMAMNTHTADLGYYDNIFWQSINGTPLGCSFMKSGVHYSGHFDPILVLLSPLYLIQPDARLIICLQIIWVLSGVIPIYRIAQRALGKPFWSAAFGVAFLLYPAMHGVVMYEFHSLALAIPLVIWLIDAMHRGAWKTYYIVFLLLLLVREDLPLLLCFVGASIIISAPKKAKKHGLLTIVGALSYFVFVKLAVMVSSDILNCSESGSCFAYYFKGLIPHKHGMSGIVLTLVNNPMYAVSRALEFKKLTYLAQLFVPLAMLPLFATKGRVILLYGLAFTLLAAHAPVFTIYFQYSSLIFPIAFALAPISLAAIGDGERLAWLPLNSQRLAHGIMIFIVVTTGIMSWKFGALMPNDAFRTGYSKLNRELSDAEQKRYTWLHAQIDKLPKDAIVGGTMTIGPQISNRMNSIHFPGQTGAEYLIIRWTDLKLKQRQSFTKWRKKRKLKRLASHNSLTVYKIPPKR